MDRRFLYLGFLVLAIGGAANLSGLSQSVYVWVGPFALILFFLGLVGSDPDGHLAHLKPEPPLR